MLEPIYMIAQTLAAIALFATLVVIALQNRQQARISRSQVNQAATDRWREYFAILRQDPEFARLARVALVHWDQLSPNQKLVVHSFWLDLVMILFTYTVDTKEKLLSPEVEEGFLRRVLSLLTTPGGRQWWEGSKGFLGEAYRRKIDARLAQPETLPPPWTNFAPWAPTDEDLRIVLSAEQFARNV